MTAEQILIELLDKLKDDVTEMDTYICAEQARDGFADGRFYTELNVNQSIIKWIEERIEIKKSVIIKENK